jgi:hypothetical protein
MQKAANTRKKTKEFAFALSKLGFKIRRRCLCMEIGNGYSGSIMMSNDHTHGACPIVLCKKQTIRKMCKTV